MNFWKNFKDSQESKKFFRNLMIWVSLRVVVLLRYEVWVLAVLTLCQYGTRTDTVSVSVYTNHNGIIFIRYGNNSRLFAGWKILLQMFSWKPAQIQNIKPRYKTCLFVNRFCSLWNRTLALISYACNPCWCLIICQSKKYFFEGALNSK